jgi:hypothetical protein
MKKLAIALAGALLLTAASPVFACPHDEDTKEAAPKTADKDKSTDKTADKTKTADKAKVKDTAKKTEKKPAAPPKVVLN